ncbi:MAG: hypothetical protein Q4B99_01030 [Clostridia bacterium]|nr:hypothetical protein [Clostridia bacterium]
MSRKTRAILLAVAGVLLLTALVWSLYSNSTSELSQLRRAMAQRGYSLTDESFYLADVAADTTVRELMGEQFDEALTEVSRESGFPSDPDRRGDIAQFLAAVDETQVITILLVDGEIEFAFIQTLGSDEALPLNPIQ